MDALILPPHLHLYVATLDERGRLTRGERLRPAEETVERRVEGGWEWIKARGRYAVDGLAEGTVLAVSAGRHPETAYVVRGGAAASIRVDQAEDILDPAGARRRAWERRLLGTGLSATPRRYRLEPGHGLEQDVVYDWHGAPYVALCTRAAASYVWVRAVTYDEAAALGIA